MWVSTYADGVYHYDPAGVIPLSCYRYPVGLPTNKLSGIFVDGWDRVWAVGFSSGFFRYTKEGDSFLQFSRETIPDLPSDVFFCAMDDREGNLWLSSDVGMVRYSPERKEVASYTVSSGILDDMMKKGVMKDASGNMYFASQSGFIRFNPDRFYVGTTTPNIVLTDFRVGDEVVKPGSGSPLGCNVDIEDEIILKHGHNSFGVSVSVLSMAARSSNKIMCLLEGYDTHPRTVSDDRSVFWYNVPAGTYKLKVWASNVNGRWNVTHSPITITVEQPLWATPWAIAIYVMVLLIIIFVFVKLYLHRMKKKEKERLEAFESEMEVRVLSENLPTALLIADDTSVRLQVKKCVEQECNVVSVMTAKRGFVILETVKINLIIADIDTRSFAGEEFCTQIKQHKEYSRIPIMILSSDTSTKRKISYMDKGVSLFVEKPLSDDYLQSAIRNIFNQEMSIESAISQSIVSMKIHRMKLDSKDEDFLNLLDKTIMDNLGNPDFDSDALEKAMSMSRSSLVRRMKALLDTTPNEYLKKRRLSVAAAMLLENNVRVNEICYAVGFRYPSYFTKCFKEAYGVIPAEYSKKCSKNV
jgi:AraC-like DNA-binding protein